MSQRDNVDLEAPRASLHQRVRNDHSDFPRTKSREDFVGRVRRLGGIMLKEIKTDHMPAYQPWKESLRSLFLGSKTWHRAPLIIIPLTLAWVSHFKSDTWGNTTTFTLCFLAMIPLQKYFDLAGNELGSFLGKDLRDLLIITLSNAIEATLATVLLFRCQLRLLQSTVIGVVLLHLLLVPGIAFFIRGIYIPEQKLKGPFPSLNLSLLMIGVLGIVTPTAFFAALDRGPVVPGTGSQSGLPPPFVPLVSDAVRGDILRMSRGIAVMLLVIYITGCLYRQKLMPGAKQGDSIPPLIPGNAADAPKPFARPYSASTNTSMTCAACATSMGDIFPCSSAGIQSLHLLLPTDPTSSSYGVKEGQESALNPWVCGVLLIAAVAFTSVTAEFLAESIEVILQTTDIQTEWFGLILLPILSFSADGAVVIWKYTGMQDLSRFLRQWAFTRVSVVLRRLAFLGARKGSRPTSECGTPQSQSQGHPGILSPVSNESHKEARRIESCVASSSASMPTPLDLCTSIDLAAAAGPNQSSSTIDQSAEDPESTRVGKEGHRMPHVHNAADPALQPQQLPNVPDPEFAHGWPIDLSIQFTLWWMPFLVLLGWWTNHPMHLLFDYFEVAMLLGACFLVNYVTVDEKTNMSEGLTMISFYAMIATAAWFYPGQPQVAFMLSCPGTVAEAVALGPEGTGENLIDHIG